MKKIGSYMYKATFIFEGRSLGEQSGDDLYEFPKKNSGHKIDGTTYNIRSFTLIGNTIIYILDKMR